MKPTTILTALALGLTTPLALAKNCNGSLHYCGRGLLNKGNYYDQIVTALSEKGQTVDDIHIHESLFYCKSNGDITFQSYCAAGCEGGGAGNSDYCG
ncbi:hypothetical protein K469DRAFT_665630 [Zopfia rhizophila CBS 207.26]|uniref:Killer toxin Kp4 domain-containing protein n=1 Tax=Zopfia rhizophila CBS 207.26 TaxID=1314779 RepID=A0A6A6E587_9PEZI|nr:hypothetical protein K469DRAFT_665630 [Zopfia rhizophila CBS 207.26]